MPQISITSSLYNTEDFLPTWRNRLIAFANKAQAVGLKFEVNAIANDPSDTELAILNELTMNSWFRLHSVPRESFYASWHRGVEVAQAPVCTSWNVDDDRNPEAILDGLRLMEEGVDVVYFPFLYKRYVKVGNVRLLVKRTVIMPPEFDRAEFTRSMHCGPFFLFRKGFYKKVGPFDDQFKIVGDFEWCIRAAKSGEFKRSKEVAGVFLNEGLSLSGSKNPLHIAENNIVYERYGIKK